MKVAVFTCWVALVINLSATYSKIQPIVKLDQQILKTYDIGPDVVVGHSKIYIDLKIFKCRFYEYTDEAVEFRTCSKTAGTCTEIQFSNVSNTIYRVMDGETDATATTQTCQKISLWNLDYKTNSYILRCHGTQLENLPQGRSASPSSSQSAVPSPSAPTPSGKKQSGSGNKPPKTGGGRRHLSSPSLDPSYFNPNVLHIYMYDGSYYSMEDGMKQSSLIADDTMSFVEWDTSLIDDASNQSNHIVYKSYDGFSKTAGNNLNKNAFSIFFRPRTFHVTTISRYFENFFDHIDNIGGLIGFMELGLVFVCVILWAVALCNKLRPKTQQVTPNGIVG